MKWIFQGARCPSLLFKCLAVVLTIFIFSSNSFSQEWIESYNTTRSLGMGGAGIAVASDETALFRNPANLGSIRNFYGTAFDPEVEATTNFSSDVFSKITGQAFDFTGVNTILKTNLEKYYHARIQVTPSVVRRNFGFGLIYRNQMHAEIDRTGTTMNAFYQSDMGAVLGANYRFFNGAFKVGANAKLINRIEVNNPLLSTVSSFDMTTIASEGSAISYDASVMLQAPVKLLPSLGVVIHDVGDTKFNYSDGVRLKTANEPATVKQSVDIGASISPIHSNYFRSTWTVEYSDATNSRGDNDSMKRTHFGFETNFRDILFFRGGLNQSYWTAGFEVASERISWQVASYGEEIGTPVNGIVKQREDRRYNMKITVRF
jgi:hypothetical protein